MPSPDCAERGERISPSRYVTLARNSPARSPRGGKRAQTWRTDVVKMKSCLLFRLTLSLSLSPLFLSLFHTQTCDVTSAKRGISDRRPPHFIRGMQVRFCGRNESGSLITGLHKGRNLFSWRIGVKKYISWYSYPGLSLI